VANFLSVLSKKHKHNSLYDKEFRYASLPYFPTILTVLAFINLSKLHPNQWMQNYLSKHCSILIALFASRTSVAFRCFKSLENLIGLTGKSISFETILKASMA
jgi:hypothetical protein